MLNIRLLNNRIFREKSMNAQNKLPVLVKIIETIPDIIINRIIPIVALFISFASICVSCSINKQNILYNNNIYKPILAYDGKCIINRANDYDGAIQLEIDKEKSDFTMDVLGNVMKSNRENKKNEAIYLYSINFNLKNIGNGTAKNFQVFDLYDSSIDDNISSNSIERFNEQDDYDFSSILIEKGVESKINMLVGLNKKESDIELNDNYLGILLYQDLNNNTHYIIIRFDVENNEKHLHIYNSDTFEFFNYIKQHNEKAKLIKEAINIYEDYIKSLYVDYSAVFR